MKINEDLLFIPIPSLMWDNSHTTPIKKIIKKTMVSTVLGQTMVKTQNQRHHIQLY